MIEPRTDLSTAANWLWMLTGTEPAPEHEAAINRYLICTIDHGFNASTFTARVVASAGAEVASAICGAIGTFTGPLHGGAPDRALDALDEIGSPDRVREWVRAKIAAGDRIMGFGHPVYRTEDPRARMLREIGIALGGPLIDFAVRVENEVILALAELKPARELYTNVEFYAGVVMEQCGIPGRCSPRRSPCPGSSAGPRRCWNRPPAPRSSGHWPATSARRPPNRYRPADHRTRATTP